MNRRRFLQALGLGGLSLATGISSCSKKPAPNYAEVSNVAKYLAEHITDMDTSDHKNNGGKLVYLFPDIHASSEHARHKIHIYRLHELMGLSLAGKEGDLEGEVTPENVQRDFEITVALQNRTGERHQLARNQGRFTKKEAKVIQTLDDFLEVSPLHSLAYPKDGVTLVGLEDKKTSKYKENFNALKIYYEKYFEVAKPIYEGERKIKEFENDLASERDHLKFLKNISKEDVSKDIAENNAQFEELAKIKKIRENELQVRYEVMKKLRKRMDEVKSNLDVSFPDYDEGIEKNFSVYRTPFYKVLDKAHNHCTMDQRSEEATRIMLSEMLKRNENQGAMVYGQAHLDQIKAALDKEGVSYIVIRPKRIKAD